MKNSFNALILALSLVLSPIATAQVPVTDVAVLAQLIKMLIALKSDISAEVSGQLGSTQDILIKAPGIGYIRFRVSANYDELYPESVGGDYEKVIKMSDEWANESRQAMKKSMNVQAKAVEDISWTAGQVVGLLTQSKFALNEMQATQVSNQLLALNIQQLTQLQNLLAAHGRAMETLSAAKNTERARSRRLSELLWEDFNVREVETSVSDPWQPR